jgi:hypothetical protein
MDFNATIDLIIKDLDEARTIIDDLKMYPGVPVLQVELAKSKCKSASEVIALLKTLQEKEAPVIEKPVTESFEEQVKAAEKAEESSILADRFVHLPSSINDQFGSQRDGSLSEIHMAKQVSRLSEVISINDRFLFVREIFKGDREAYNQALAKLENAENLTDAKAVLMSYTGNNPDSEASKQLLDLVKRKFPHNG